jgi:hypothetical protein
MLEIPYAIGKTDNKFYIRMPSGRINRLALSTLIGTHISVQTDWNEAVLYGPNIEKAETVRVGEDSLLSIYISEGTEEQIKTVLSDPATSHLYLYFGDVRIGELCETDFEDHILRFRLYIPENDTDVIAHEIMLNYVSNTITSASDTIAYCEKVLWFDENNELLSRKEIPLIPLGVDNERFSSLFSHVKNLGGQAAINIDLGYPSESLEIKFKQWNGNFPEDALKMIEDIFTEYGTI